ncbi:hypothetical protein BJY04DRAFT_146097 [Aspergillus karnatakaensis]|uniref:uncharacterized protein n=1 Tax=Aspergillus karnatakaensis TaxID=1810916 RepID=UPI003CCCDD55
MREPEAKAMSALSALPNHGCINPRAEARRLIGHPLMRLLACLLACCFNFKLAGWSFYHTWCGTVSVHGRGVSGGYKHGCTYR